MHTRLTMIAVALAACGGSTTSAPGESASCSVTLSGAVTGTFDCQHVTSAWASSNNITGFAFSFSSSGSPSINVAIGFTGEPHAGNYLNTDTGATSALTVHTGSGASAQYWTATVG